MTFILAESIKNSGKIPLSEEKRISGALSSTIILPFSAVTDFSGEILPALSVPVSVTVPLKSVSITIFAKVSPFSSVSISAVFSEEARVLSVFSSECNT